MIDLSKFDLQGLQALHVSYEHIIEDHKNALKNLKNESSSAHWQIDVLEKKILFFQEQLEIVKNVIKRTSSEKLRFSVETLFMYYGFIKKTIQIYFMTTSKAYETYGPYVTGQIVYDEQEIYKLLQANKENRISDGIIHFNDEVSDFDDNKRKLLRKEGFYASEISHIY